MLCKKCGVDNPENAKFCGNCGVRLDEKVACKACGQFNDENSTYCIYCGARIDGKKVCSNCGETYTGNFCTECGYSEKKPTAKVAVVENQENTVLQGQLLGKILNITAGVFSMLAVLSALIFVFFIGVTSETMGTYTVKDTDTIFYYFGTYQEEMSKSLLEIKQTEVFPWFVERLETTGSIIGIIGLVIGILALVSVVICSIVAVSIYVKSWLSNTEKRADKWALASVASFFIFALAFLSVHTFAIRGLESISANMSSEVLEVLEGYGLSGATVLLSGATKAGIILCAIFIGLFGLCRLAQHGKKLLKVKTLVPMALAVVCIVFASLTLAMVKSSAFTIYFGNELVEIGIDLSYSLSNMTAIGIFMTGCTELEILDYKDCTIALDTMLTCNSIAQICLIVTIIFAGISLFTSIKKMVYGKGSSAWSVLAVLGAITVLVLTIVSQGQFEKGMNIMIGEEMYGKIFTPNYTKAICAVVFAVLSSIVDIVYSAVKKALDKNN